MCFFFFFFFSLPFSNSLPKCLVLTKAPKAVYPTSCGVNSNQVPDKKQTALSLNIWKHSWPHCPKVAFWLFFSSFLKPPDISWQRWMGNKLSCKHATTCSLICSWYPSYPGLPLPHQKGLGFPQIMCHIVQLCADLSDVLDIPRASRCLCIGDRVCLP